MKLIRITLFWLIVFVLFELFFGEAVMSVIVNIWIGIFVLLVIGLIIYALLAKKIQTSLNMPKNLDMQPQTTDEFFADKPQILHDDHKQMADNGFVLVETIFWVNNNLHFDVGVYRSTKRDSLMGAIYHINSDEEQVAMDFFEEYDNNQSVTVSNIKPALPFFDVSDEIIKLQMPHLISADELLGAFDKASSKINAKPKPIGNIIDAFNRFYHKEKQAEIKKGYYKKSDSGQYITTYKGALCALYKFLPITNQLYFYQRERYIKK